MPTHLDSSSLTALDLISCWLVSLLSGVDWSLSSPFANSFLELLFPTLWLAFPSYFWSPEISSPKPFVWFRAKTDKGIVCLIFFKTKDHHHHHVIPLAQISQTLSRHFSLLFIASGRSSGLHPVSSHSFCMYVRAGRPAFARPYVGVHTYELVPASPEVSFMSGSSNLDSFRDGRQVSI